MSDMPEKSAARDFDAYLDGTMSAEARARFQAELAANPQLQAELLLQQQINAALRSRFIPPVPPPDLLAQLREAAPEAPQSTTIPHPSRRWFTLAGAASAAAVVWGVLGWQYYSANKQPVYNPRIPLATIYEQRVAEGFKPTWVCEDDHIFASTFFERQGQGLLLAPMPEGTHMVGLAYFGGLSRYTTTMLARVNGTPVMVFVDRHDCGDPPEQPSKKSGLHLFRKELGGLVMYELSPFPEPRVMDYLYAAEVPPPQAAK